MPYMKFRWMHVFMSELTRQSHDDSDNSYFFFKELNTFIWIASNETWRALHLQKASILPKWTFILILCDSLSLCCCYSFAVIVRRDEYVVTLIHWVFEITHNAALLSLSVGWSLGTFIGQVCVVQYLRCTDAAWLMSWACRLAEALCQIHYSAVDHTPLC